MNAEILTIKGEKFAVVPWALYERCLEAMEDAKDIADAKAIESNIKSGEGEYYPSEIVDAMIDGENMVKVFREYRGLTQESLAAKINKSVELIRKIESGKSEGSISTIKAIAEALNVDINLIV